VHLLDCTWLFTFTARPTPNCQNWPESVDHMPIWTIIRLFWCTLLFHRFLGGQRFNPSKYTSCPSYPYVSYFEHSIRFQPYDSLYIQECSIDFKSLYFASILSNYIRAISRSTWCSGPLDPLAIDTFLRDFFAGAKDQTHPTTFFKLDFQCVHFRDCCYRASI
jgi:hypothetical protein